MINLNYLHLLLLITLILIFYLNFDIIKTKLIKYLFGKADTEKYVKICPKCGSANIKIDFSNPVVWAYGTNTKYKCKQCSYLANTFPEIPEDYIQNYKKELKHKMGEKPAKVKSELIDATTGYPVGVLEIILAFLGFILIPFVLLTDGFDLVLLFLLFWTLISAYLVWRIYKKRKPIN